MNTMQHRAHGEKSTEYVAIPEERFKELQKRITDLKSGIAKRHEQASEAWSADAEACCGEISTLQGAKSELCERLDPTLARNRELESYVRSLNEIKKLLK